MDDPGPIPVQFTVTLTALVYPEPEVGGYSAEVPALPGCYTQGETLEEIQANLREAAEGWLGSAHDEGRQTRRSGFSLTRPERQAKA
jgi:predicted RNase H-like HicB family nuclease